MAKTFKQFILEIGYPPSGVAWGDDDEDDKPSKSSAQIEKERKEREEQLKKHTEWEKKWKNKDSIPFDD